MKELNTFRQFLAEGKEEKVSEDKIERAIKDTLKKEGGAAGIDPLKKAVKSLNVDTDFDIEKFLKKMSNVEKHKNGDYILTPLKENDEVLDAILNEENLNEDDIKSENDMRDFAVKALTNNGFPKPAKLEVVGADKNEVKDAAELGKMTLQNMLSAIFKKYGPNFLALASKGKLSLTPLSKEGGAMGFGFRISQEVEKPL